MGQQLVRTIHETDNVELSAAFEHEKSSALGQDIGALAGIGENGILVSSDLEAGISGCDGVIDFTTPATSCLVAELAASSGCVHVIGTTGCSPEQDETIAGFAQKTAIVKSGNMSLGVNLLAILVENAAKALDEDSFDIEVVEMHHKHKVDAPSGTALLLGEAAAKGRNADLAEQSVRVRDGHTGARENGTIGFATLRGGSVIGDHTVILAGGGERIELSHLAQDRTIYANGAVKAALWANGQSSGLYTMRDVLGI